MGKTCPFLKDECRKKQCQLWVEHDQGNEEKENCSIWVIAQSLNRDLLGVAKNVQAIKSKMSGEIKGLFEGSDLS